MDAYRLRISYREAWDGIALGTKLMLFNDHTIAHHKVSLGSGEPIND